MLITEILARNARVYGDEVALIERDPVNSSRKEITWNDFDAAANRVANVLLAKGIKKDDKVVHLMMNCIDWLPAYFGILRTGAWVVPLNFRFSADDIKLCTEIAEAQALVFGEEFIDRVEQIKTALDKTVASYLFVGPEDMRPAFAEQYADLLASASSEAPQVKSDLNDSAALYFTSGTTGTPKAVHLTHRNLEHACYVENRHHYQTHADSYLCIPPLYHTGAKMHWFGNFLVGAKGVLLKGLNPKWILEAISEEQVTNVFLHLGLENTHKVGAIGVPGFDWECRIVDFEQQPVAQGEPGELLVKGPGVMREYYKNPEATAVTLKDGWLHTGDIARMDEDGFIWLVDRAKDVIITGGENIFPVEIESHIMSHPKVQDVGVIGMPDERLGEIVAAIIKEKPNQTLTEEEIIKFCEDLPRYKRPKKIIFGEVPRSPTGKIEKPKLRKKYTGVKERIGKLE